MENFTVRAIEKLEKQSKEVKGMKETAVAGETAKALISFCKQDEEFAQAVVQSDKTFGEACKYAVKDCKNSISDIEVYRKAVEFYFPGATVEMIMKVDLCGSVKKESNTISLSFADLFGD